MGRARTEQNRTEYMILVGKPQGKRLLGRPRRTWLDSIKMDHRERGWAAMDWTHLTQDTDQ
jgi:hypothetical protein